MSIVLFVFLAVFVSSEELGQARGSSALRLYRRSPDDDGGDLGGEDDGGEGGLSEDGFVFLGEGVDAFWGDKRRLVFHGEKRSGVIQLLLYSDHDHPTEFITESCPRPDLTFMHTTTSLRPLVARSLAPRLRSRLNSSKVEPPPPGGHSPLIADSKLLKSTRDAALKTPGINWIEGDNTAMVGGRETRKMNTYQAVRDAMR